MYKPLNPKIRSASVLVFCESDESFDIWKEKTPIPASQIIRIFKRKQLYLFDKRKAMIRFVGNYAEAPNYLDFANFAVSKGFFAIYE